MHDAASEEFGPLTLGSSRRDVIFGWTYVAAGALLAAGGLANVSGDLGPGLAVTAFGVLIAGAGLAMGTSRVTVCPSGLTYRNGLVRWTVAAADVTAIRVGTAEVGMGSRRAAIYVDAGSHRPRKLTCLQRRDDVDGTPAAEELAQRIRLHLQVG